MSEDEPHNPQAASKGQRQLLPGGIKAGGLQVPTGAVWGAMSVSFKHEVFTSHVATDLGHMLRSAFAATKRILIFLLPLGGPSAPAS